MDKVVKAIVAIGKFFISLPGEFIAFACDMVKDFKPAYRAAWLTLQGQRGESPMKKDGERLAGDYVLREMLCRVGVALLAVGVIMGIALIAFFLNKFVWIILYVSMPLLLVYVPLLPVLWHQIENYSLAYRAEIKVGEELDKIGFQWPDSEDGRLWRVFHGLHGFDDQGGDIDHVIVCSKGVFIIETKSLRQNFGATNKITFKEHGKSGALLRDGDSWPLRNKNPIGQAKRNAKRLHEYLNRECLKEEGEKIPFVSPIVALPGWDVYYEVFPKDEGIFPCNPKQLLKELRDNTSEFLKPGNELNEKQFRRICATIEKAARA